MNIALTNTELRLAGECAQALEVIWNDLLNRDPLLQLQVRLDPVDQITLDCHRVNVLVAGCQDAAEMPLLLAPHEWAALQNVVHAVYEQVQLGVISFVPHTGAEQTLTDLHCKLLPHLHRSSRFQA